MTWYKSWAICKTSILEKSNLPQNPICQIVWLFLFTGYLQLLIFWQSSRERLSERIERNIKSQKQGLSLPSFHDCQWSCKKGKIVMAPILLAGITTSDQSSCQFGCQFGNIKMIGKPFIYNTCAILIRSWILTTKLPLLNY